MIVQAYNFFTAKYFSSYFTKQTLSVCNYKFFRFSFAILAELGDYEPLECGESYAEDLNLVPKRENLDRALDEAKSLHRTEMAKKNPADVEQLFLKKAATLDTYGVDPQPVKDQKGIQLYLGINHSGILTFQVNRKTHHFKW